MAPRSKRTRSARDSDEERPRGRAAPSGQSGTPISPSRALAGRPLSNGRLVDFHFLSREGFNIGKFFTRQGWAFLCRTEVPIYPKLVREFYLNLSISNQIISSNVKGVSINLNRAALAEILRVPPDGDIESHPDGRSERIEAILGLDDGAGAGYDKINASMLSVEMRLLHNMVARMFIPRIGSFHMVTERDLSIMFHLISELPFDLISLMMAVMAETLNRSKAPLPYAMFLTHIFHSLKIDLKGEESFRLFHTDIYNRNTMRRMGFSKVDGKWIRGKEKDVEATDEPSTEEPAPGSTQPEDIPPPPTSASGSAAPPPQPSASEQKISVELNQEQLQFIVKEVTSAIMSSRSSGESVSTSTDYSVIPHISTFHEFMRETLMKIENIERQISNLNARQRLREMDEDNMILKPSMEKLDHLIKEIGIVNGQIAFGTTLAQKLDDAMKNLLSQINVTEFKTEPAPAHSPPHPMPDIFRSTAPHLRRGRGRGRGTGSSSAADKSSTINVDD